MKFDVLATLRDWGWSVAVHNDYRLNGERYTFWLFTHPDGRWIKGEGRGDDEALRNAMAHAAPPASVAAPKTPSLITNGWSKFYVSPERGDDAAEGTEDKPLATVAEAWRRLNADVAAPETRVPIPVNTGSDVATVQAAPETPSPTRTLKLIARRAERERKVRERAEHRADEHMRRADAAESKVAKLSTALTEVRRTETQLTKSLDSRTSLLTEALGLLKLFGEWEWTHPVDFTNEGDVVNHDERMCPHCACCHAVGEPEEHEECDNFKARLFLLRPDVAPFLPKEGDRG